MKVAFISEHTEYKPGYKYLAPYLPYGMDDIDEKKLWDVFWFHALGAVIGRYRVPMSTAYPCGE